MRDYLTTALMLAVMISFSHAKAENLCAVRTSQVPIVQRVSLSEGERWELVWSDEFDIVGQVDINKWTHEINHVTTNAEKQYYTDREHTNSSVQNGLLVIEGREEEHKGRKYTSARLNSTASWTYGRYEFRARAPSGSGTWPAIWMLGRKVVYGTDPWLDNGEIDIMETSGKYPNDITHAIYSRRDNFWKGRKKIRTTHVPTADTEFHTYAMEWLPGSFKFFIDGRLTFHDERLEGEGWMNWPFDQDMYLIINLAIDGTISGPVLPGVLPARFEIDYVRVYRPTRAEDCIPQTGTGDFI